ncbi:hypothetical protein F5B21DRAFT_526437 [Xylaria acuta]|nr:hypothetical protein F5B21DRAFT_526437 [Xylaria acuta]
MPNPSYGPLSLNLDPTELGGLMHAIATVESRQDDGQSNTTCLQDGTSFITGSNDGTTDTEPTPGVQTTPHPKMHQKGKTPRPVHRKFRGPWGWETVAFLVAISLPAATVVPKWPYNITLGAVTALLATIIRSLLLIILGEFIGHSRWSWFQAPPGRGPWGSLNYLTRVHRLHPSTIAAIVLVLSLGISTFTQQAIRSVACTNADLTTKAWVRTAQIIYNKDNDALLPNIDIAVTQTLFQGRDTNNRQSSFYCPSGNCTFRATEKITYSSLGVRSKCVYVSPKMDYVVRNHILEPIDEDIFLHPTFITRFGTVRATLSDIGLQAGIPTIGKACNILGRPNDGPTPLKNKSSQSYSVCWLCPCIKHYSGLVSNGRLQEKYSVYGSYVDPCYINGMRANRSQTPPLFTGDNYPPNKSQTTDLNCWYGFTGSLSRLLDGELTINWSNGVPLKMGEYWMNYLLGLPWYSRPDLIDPFDTISTGIDIIATTMTNAFREIGNNSYGGVSKANGTILRAAVRTETNRPWFSFPAAIILATFYILVHTVVDSIQDSSLARTGKWSVLLVLYCGLEKEAKKGDLETEHDLSHDGKRRKVCLRRDIKGDWRLENDANGPRSDSSDF